MKKHRILVVDDDTKTVASIKLYLEHAGFEVSIAYGGRKALEEDRGDMGIAGGAPGVNSMLEFDFETGYTVIVMSNYDPPTAGKVARQILSWLARVKK